MKKLRAGLGFWLAAGIAGFVGFANAQEKLSLADYLNQVKTQGPDYRSAEASVVGLQKQSHQMDLLYSPTLIANYNHMDDNEVPSGMSNPRTEVDSAGVSLAAKLPFGPTLSLGYSLNSIHLTQSSLISAFASDPSLASVFPSAYFQTSPTLMLSVPLFKDFGGFQTRSGVHKVQYQLESASLGAAFMRDQALFKAKVAYWSLALSQAEVAIREDSLDRTRKIWNWAKRRVARNLADAPDALQAEAAVRVAELDLQTAKEKQRTARLEFNRFRNLETDEVPERLESLADTLAQMKVEIPDTLPKRLDLKAAELTAEQQKAAYDEAHQNIYPDITAYASWRGNGLDRDFGGANQASFQNTYPTYNIGAQFTLPLDLFTASRVAEGYKSNYESALLTLKNKRIEVNQQWKDLKGKITDVDKRLEMANRIEDIQKNKANQEKRRLDLGRTTQFQLLSYENDYSFSRLNRMALTLEKLSLLAQAQWWLSTQ